MNKREMSLLFSIVMRAGFYKSWQFELQQERNKDQSIKNKRLMQISSLNISILSPRNLHQITTHFDSNQSVSWVRLQRNLHQITQSFLSNIKTSCYQATFIKATKEWYARHTNFNKLGQILKSGKPTRTVETTRVSFQSSQKDRFLHWRKVPILLEIIHHTNIDVICKGSILREWQAMRIASFRHTVNRVAIEQREVTIEIIANLPSGIQRSVKASRSH